MSVLEGIAPAASPQTLETVIEAAQALNASDVTILRIRHQAAVAKAKVDGVWQMLPDIPEPEVAAIANRMKGAMNGFSTGQTALVQEGGLTVTTSAGEALLRVAVFPSSNGEKITLRLPPTGPILGLDEIGAGERNLEAIKVLLQQPDGLIPVVGPVGSGKTVFLYAALQHLAGPGKSVSTVEDPPERVLPGVTHMAINDEAGATYAHFMKSLLRGSDDLVLLGEIRDHITGESAIQIGKAGTLVLTTLHASNNFQAVARLTEFSGQSMSSVLDTTRGFVSQRLLRRICVACGGDGCTFCHGSRYSGRVPVHEVLLIDDELRSAAADGASMQRLRAIAATRGLPTMEEDARRLMQSGVTDEAEVRRVMGHAV